MYRVLLFVALVGSSMAQILTNRSCSDTQTTTAVDLTRLAGIWYQIERTTPTEELGDCSTSTYGTPVLNLTGLLSNRWEINRQPYFRNGTYARINTENNPGRFNVWFGNESFTYDVLAADSNFSSYALIQGCRDVTQNSSYTWAWKFSRSRNMASTGVSQINSVVSSHDILRLASWRVTTHGDTCGSGANLYTPPLLVLITFFFIHKKMI